VCFWYRDAAFDDQRSEDQQNRIRALTEDQMYLHEKGELHLLAADEHEKPGS